MKQFLEKVRTAQWQSLPKQIIATTGVVLLGFALGVLQKDGWFFPIICFRCGYTTGYRKLFWTPGNMDFIGDHYFCVFQISIKSIR